MKKTLKQTNQIIITAVGHLSKSLHPNKLSFLYYLQSLITASQLHKAHDSLSTLACTTSLMQSHSIVLSYKLHQFSIFPSWFSVQHSNFLISKYISIPQTVPQGNATDDDPQTDFASHDSSYRLVNVYSKFTFPF